MRRATFHPDLVRSTGVPSPRRSGRKRPANSSSYSKSSSVTSPRASEVRAAARRRYGLSPTEDEDEDRDDEKELAGGEMLLGTEPAGDAYSLSPACGVKDVDGGEDEKDDGYGDRDRGETTMGSQEAESMLLDGVETELRVAAGGSGGSPGPQNGVVTGSGSSTAEPREELKDVAGGEGEGERGREDGEEGTTAAAVIVPETAPAIVPETEPAVVLESLRVKTEATDDEEEDEDNDNEVIEQNAQTEIGESVVDGTFDDRENGRAGEHGAETEYVPREARYDKADALIFTTLCTRFETLWAQRKKTSNKRSKDDLLNYLLPPKLLGEHMSDTSPYPVLRLILPDIDSSRPNLGLKEKTIARTWAEAMGLSQGSSAYLKLLNFHDPTLAGPTAVGDLSVALKEVMEARFPGRGSGITVGRMNELLDALANVKKSGKGGSSSQHVGRNTQHDWRDGSTQGMSQGSGGRRRGDFKKKQQQRTRWVEKLIGLNLSPNEHKWVVRILLGKLEIGLRWKSILNHYHEWAEELYSANNSLKMVCRQLSDPEYVRRREEEERRAAEEEKDENRKAHLPHSSIGAALGNTIAPMLGARTFFGSALTDIGARHRAYAAALARADPEDKDVSSLALNFPAFAAEIKLDGERMIVHVDQGIVTMNTRNGTWYSNIYSPVLGPAIRRAIARYDVDVILDGEIVAWDQGKGEHIPFGSNRTVAIARAEWMRRKDMIEDQDMNLHEERDDINVMSQSDMWRRPSNRARKDETEDNEEGEECWLKFVIFDILLLRGPDAANLLKKSCLPFDRSFDPTKYSSGSITGLDGYKRKFVLYNLVEQQNNEVVLVDSVVVRCDGECSMAQAYFSGRGPKEHDCLPPVLDSIDSLKIGMVQNITEVDKKRRNGQTDEQIEEKRAQALEGLYTEIVEKRHEEGLIFKDLAAPYYFGPQSKSMKYWLKLKADYEKAGHASDIDVVVLGANYASGMRKAGLLSHFVLGCVDNEATDLKFMTLGKVSGGGIKRDYLKKLLDFTGFKPATATEDVKYGKWFKLQNHGKDLPDFISQRSCQRSVDGDDDGWSFNRDKYPDAWIRPEDSFVLTINAGEIVTSDEWSAGVTLRFPRIRKVRAEGFVDPKPVSEVETVEGLQSLYLERRDQMSEMVSESQESRSALAAIGRETSECRFLTKGQNAKKKRATRRNASSLTQEVKASRIPTPPSSKASMILSDYTFTVLEGIYQLNANDLDVQEAEEQGWSEEASSIRCREDFVRFIQRHSGQCMLTANDASDFVVGGRLKDAKVANLRRLIEAASIDDITGRSRSRETLKNMLKLGGIVKWQFVVAAVHKMIEEIRKHKSEEDEADGGDPRMPTRMSIKECAPNLLRPRRFDYLVISKVKEEILLGTEDRFGMHLWDDSNKVDFKRALLEVSREKRKNVAEGLDIEKTPGNQALPTCRPSQSSKTWQFRALESLDEDELWILSGKRQAFWPCSSGDVAHPSVDLSSRTSKDPSSRRVVLYPDLFGGDLGLVDANRASEEAGENKSLRWDVVAEERKLGQVAASLPLAKAMGAQVTPHLHNGVTHILCEMKGRDLVEWKETTHVSIFVDRESGEQLHSRLLLFCDEGIRFGNENVVFLVTARWVTENWKRKQYDMNDGSCCCVD